MLNVKLTDKIKSKELREMIGLPQAEHYILSPIVRYLRRILYMSPEALQRKLFYADIQGERCLDQFGEVLERCEGQVVKMEEGGTVPWEKKLASALELDARDAAKETSISVKEGYEKAMLYGPVSIALKNAFKKKKEKDGGRMVETDTASHEDMPDARKATKSLSGKAGSRDTEQIRWCIGKHRADRARIDDGTWVAYTDGSAIGVPGHLLYCGAGAVLERKGTISSRREKKKSLGLGTNNKGELEAIGLVIELLQEVLCNGLLASKQEKVVIFSDSQFTVDLLNGLKEPSRFFAHRVERIRNELKGWPNLVLRWVPAHILNDDGSVPEGFELNHRADAIAGEAAEESRKTSLNGFEEYDKSKSLSVRIEEGKASVSSVFHLDESKDEEKHDLSLPTTGEGRQRYLIRNLYVPGHKELVGFGKFGPKTARVLNGRGLSFDQLFNEPDFPSYVEWMIDEVDKRVRRQSVSVEWNKLLNYVAKFRRDDFFTGKILNSGRLEDFFMFRANDLLCLV